MKTFNVRGLKDYKNVFVFLEDCLKKRSIVLLEGELGAGKTTFVKEYLKFKYELDDQSLSKEGFSSPTFTIQNQYEIKNDLILHFDFYRVKEKEYDLEEHIEDLERARVIFIEWSKNLLIKSIFSKNECIELIFRRGVEAENRTVQVLI